MEKRWFWRWASEGAERFSTGLESDLVDGASPDDAERGKFFIEVDETDSRDDSIDGNGSTGLSRPRCVSYGGGVSDLCRGDAAYECGWKDR